jgi:hypothetical protein
MLAHAYFPLPNNVGSHAGDAHFDHSENWISGDALVTGSGRRSGQGGGAKEIDAVSESLMFVGASGGNMAMDDNTEGWGWLVDPAPDHGSDSYVRDDSGDNEQTDYLTAPENETGHKFDQEHDQRRLTREPLTAFNRKTHVRDTACDWHALVDVLIAEL